MRLIEHLIHGSAWAMHRPVLERLVVLASRAAGGERLMEDEVDDAVRERQKREEEALKAAEVPGVPVYESRLHEERGAAPLYNLAGSVAIVRVEGVIAPKSSMVNGASQPQGTSVGTIEKRMAAAVADSKVAKIVMLVDSPGGYAMGIERAVDAVRGADAAKPVHAYARNMMASAAMWIGAQARSITASRMADVGSIGVYTVLEDSTKYFEKQGITRHLIKAGLYKGVGVDGIPVTEQDLQVVAAEVVSIYDAFVTDIAAGRKMDRAKALALADGRTHTGEQLVATGLVDKLGRLDGLVNELNSLGNPTSGARTGSGARVSTAAHTQQEIRTMADENKIETPTAPAVPARVAATAAELRTAFPDDAEFRFDAMEKGLSLIEAKAAYSDVLAGKLKASEAERAKLASGLAAAKVETPPTDRAALEKAARGGNPVGFVGKDGPGADATWEGQIRTLANEKFGGDFQRALNASAKIPALKAGHGQWVADGCPKFWRQAK